MKNKSVLFMAQAAMIAAIYVVLTIVFAPFSFGEPHHYEIVRFRA